MSREYKAAPLVGLILCLVFAGCDSPPDRVDDRDDLLEYNGRIGRDTPDAAVIYWPGSSIRTRFAGTGLAVILKDERGHNYFNVIIDGDSVYHLKLDSAKKKYTLAEGLSEGEHTAELFRLTDWNNGKTWFYGFQHGPKDQILPIAPKERRMEFYGNSITVGAAIEDQASGLHDNHYLSYAALTARHYNAQYSCIARSGIGLMVSWFSLIMPEMYNRLDPFDSTSVWDFARFTPDVVVVNLMQNDYALSTMPDYDQFRKRFGDKAPTAEHIIKPYRTFISTLRGHYPEAHIICALGNMDATSPGSPWPGYIKEAVVSMSDAKVYTLFFPFKNTDGHPNVREHRQMADSLIEFIDQYIKW